MLFNSEFKIKTISPTNGIAFENEEGQVELFMYFYKKDLDDTKYLDIIDDEFIYHPDEDKDYVVNLEESPIDEDFIIKTPPTAFLIKKYAKVQKGSVKGSKEFVGSITEEQVKEIATIKLPDLNAYDLEAAIKTVKGTALNMGIEVK